MTVLSRVTITLLAVSLILSAGGAVLAAGPERPEVGALAAATAVSPEELLVDADGDGWDLPDDCNDNDDQIFPGAPELCNGLDDNCDGFADEIYPTLGDACTAGTGTCESSGTIVCTGPTTAACDAVAGLPTTEVCDGLDNDCNGAADFPGETTDLDGDGSLACEDCDDTDPDNYPSNVEFCDGLDNDCDGFRDNGLPDSDLDGIGDACDACPDDPGALTASTYLRGFEGDTADWFDQDNGWSGDAISVASGTDGVTSYAGGSHGNFTQNDVNQLPGDNTGPFSRFDGYRFEWLGQYSASIFVYLDTSWALGEGFDYSVASSGTNGAHRRDFIFHVTKDTGTGALLVAGSNNSNFAPREDLDTLNNYEVTTTGWYELRHTFRDDGGVLAVDLQLLDSGGGLLFTETRSDASDLIPSVVGGNRYAWFTHITVAGGIEVDNHAITRGDGDSDGDGACDSDDLCPGFDDTVNVDGDPVPAGCDCDDNDANNYPGNTEICDGQDNDCSAAVNTSTLGDGGWFSDDTRADGAGVLSQSTNLISDTLTDDPEAGASGSPAADPDITRQIEFVVAPATVPAGTNTNAVHLSIAAGAGGGKSQISHRKDDGVGHAPGSVLAPGVALEYSWMGDGTATVTASLKLGIKTAEFGSTGVSSRTGENAWDKVLIYEPGQGNGINSDGTWKTETIDWDTGSWWIFDRTAGAGTIGTPLTLENMSTSAILVGGGPKTIADVYSLITAPGAHITSIQVGIGSGNAGGSVYVNQIAASFYRAGDVTTFGGGVLSNPGANFPGELIDDDGDGSLACNDCDDNDAANYPGNPEVCDGQDNNCDLAANFPGETTDDDGDLVVECADCDDNDPDAFPGNTEICDGIDNDCDGSADFPGETTDDDGDLSIACLDCDDTSPDTFPGASEICDGLDNDCDGFSDEGLPDSDLDGIGDACDGCPDDPGALTASTYLRGFEGDTADWFDQDNGWNGDAIFVASGTDGVASHAGGFHGNFTQTAGTGPFSRFDGYRLAWLGQYSTSLFVYLDTSWALGEGFDYSVASSGTNGAHRRDFIFHVTKDTGTGALLVAGSNNSNFAPREDLDTLNNYEVTTTGWYELRHTFRDDGGVLAVDLQLLDSGGGLLFTETRSDASDLIPSVVGGNRYAWFTHITVAGGIEVDNHAITRGDGDSDGDGACDSDDLCPGFDDTVNVDGDPVPAGCDCDDNDANNYPGNTEICDGQDNNCAGELNISGLGTGGWYSDDTRADGTGAQANGTNLVSNTLTDNPEAAASGVPAHDADINQQIVFGPAPGVVPAGTHTNAVNLNIDISSGVSGKSQISHRKDDGVGHFPGSDLGSGFAATYSWMGDGATAITASLKFGIKTADYGSTGSSSRTGENVWDKVLIYEPGQGNGATADGLWQTETINYTTGKWWFFDRTTFNSTQSTPMTLSEMSTSAQPIGAETVADVYARMTAPGAHVTSVQFGIGSNNPGGNVYVNQFTCSAYQGSSTLTFGGPASLLDPFADFPGEQIDDDGDGSLACNDCDDLDDANYPGNTEICDGQDNDCDLGADFPGELIDNDGDLSLACVDCDDTNADVFPGNTERCDDTILAGSMLDRDCDTVLNNSPADDDCDVGNVCRADFCDTNDACAFLASGDCGLSGRVLYNLVTPAGPAPTPGTDSADVARPVEGAEITLTGDTPGLDLTDAFGDYAFDPVAGDLVLDARKTAELATNDFDNLSGLDASLIAQSSVGLFGLSPRQAVAADVSDNGAVTSFDASLVAQKVTNPAFLLPVAVNSGSDFAFFDVTQSFTPIAADTTGVDLVAVLYGDVTMDWTAATMPASVGPQNAVDGTDGANDFGRERDATSGDPLPDAPLSANLTPRQGDPAVLYMVGAPRRLENGNVEYVLGIDNGDGILAIDFVLDGGQRGTRLIGASVDGVAADFQVVSHDGGERPAALAVFGIRPIVGTGSLLRIEVSQPAGGSGFPFKVRASANEGLIPITMGPELVLPVSPRDRNISDGAGVIDIRANEQNSPATR